MHEGGDRKPRQDKARRGRNSLRLLAVVAAALLSTARPGAQAPFTLSSTDLRDGGRLDAAQRYSGDGCGGANRSPQLSWQHAPPGTRAYAITVYALDSDRLRSAGPRSCSTTRSASPRSPMRASPSPTNASRPTVSRFAPRDTGSRRRGPDR
ncbi:MAG: hypothetical protein VB138_12555 [Burkholderia sp.]